MRMHEQGLTSVYHAQAYSKSVAGARCQVEAIKAMHAILYGWVMAVTITCAPCTDVVVYACCSHAGAYPTYAW